MGTTTERDMLEKNSDEGLESEVGRRQTQAYGPKPPRYLDYSVGAG